MNSPLKFARVLALAALLAIAQEGRAQERRFLIGTDVGAAQVDGLNVSDVAVSASLMPYEGFTGGVRVASADVSGDGVADIVTGSGDGAAAHVKVFDGATLAEIRSFLPFAVFTGGVYVAAGDVNGDRLADIIVGTGAGAGTEVKVLSGLDGSVLHDLFPYQSPFTGGVRVAAGDVNGDGKMDVITGSGGSVPHVKAFDGVTGTEIRSFFAFTDVLTGIFVASGEMTGDSSDDIIVGQDDGGSGRVKVFDGQTGQEVRSFQPYGETTIGVRVGAERFDSDAISEIITGPGPGSDSIPIVKVFSGRDLTSIRDIFAFAPTFTGGVFVTGGIDPAPDKFQVLSAAGGTYFRHKLHGQTLYVVHELNLGIYDLTSGEPRAVRHMPLTRERGFGAIAVEGNALAIGGAEGGSVVLYDVSIPHAPLLRGTYHAEISQFASGPLGEIAIEGDLLVLQSGFGKSGPGDLHLEIVDISDLSNPVRVGRYDLWPDAGGQEDFDNAAEIEFIGSLIYYGGARGFTVLDASNPAEPQFVTRIPVAEGNAIRDIVVGEGRAAALTQQSDLLVYDLTSPAAPVLSSTTPLAALGNPVGISGLVERPDVWVGLSSLTTNGHNFYIYNLLNPAMPELGSSLPPITGTLMDFEVRGNSVASVSQTGDSRHFLLDMILPDPIFGFTSSSTPLIPLVDEVVLREGGLGPVFYGFGFESNFIVAIDDPENPIPQVVNEVPSFGNGFEVNGSQRVGFQRYETLLFEEENPAVTFAGLYDLSDPINPRRAGTIRIDPADPNNLIPTGGTPGTSPPFHISGNDLAVIGAKPGDNPDNILRIQLFDITNLAAPAPRSIVSILPDGGYALSVAIIGDILYASGRGPEPGYEPIFTAWNIADRSAPVPIETVVEDLLLDPGEMAEGLQTSEGHLLFRVGDSARGINLKNPAAPVFRFEYQSNLPLGPFTFANGYFARTSSFGGSDFWRGQLEAFGLERSRGLISTEEVTNGRIAAEAYGEGLTTYLYGLELQVVRLIAQPEQRRVDPFTEFLDPAAHEVRGLLDYNGDGVIDGADGVQFVADRWQSLFGGANPTARILTD